MFIFRNSTVSYALLTTMLWIFALSTPPFSAFSSQEGPAKKIVILYSSIGMGHLSAARAIEERILTEDPSAKVVLKDTRDFMGSVHRRVHEFKYWFVVKNFPNLFDNIFQNVMDRGNRVIDLEHKPTNFKVDLRKMAKWIDRHGPTRIIATHYGSTEALIKLRNQGLFKDIPIAWLHTDYFEGFFPRISKHIERTFLGIQQLMDRWVERGVDPSTISLTGLPVNPKLYDPIDRDRFYRDHNLDPTKKTIVLASGGEGVGDFVSIVKSLSRNIDEPVQIVAITAKNEEHYKNLTDLKETLPAHIDLRITGFIPNEELIGFIKISDLYITKSGGLSPTEGFIIGKPMILLDIYGGHERDNALLFERLNMAMVNRNQDRIGQQAKTLLSDPEKMKEMIDRQRAFSNSLNFRAITDFVFEDQTETMAKKVGVFPLGVHGVHVDETMISAREALSRMEEKSPAQVEVILAYGSSLDGEYLGQDTNPFGHLAIRVGDIVYTSNAVAMEGEDRLMYKTTLFDYLFGVERRTNNGRFGDIHGSAYAKDHLSIRINGLSEEAINAMHLEAQKMEEEWARGEINWTRKINCADHVDRIFKAGQIIDTGEAYVDRRGITMPVGVFDDYLDTLNKTRPDLETSIVQYQRVSDSRSMVKTTRFPLSFTRMKESIFNLIKRPKIADVELQASQRVAFYPGDPRAHLEDLEDTGQREQSYTLSEATVDELRNRASEIQELEKQIIGMNSEIQELEVSTHVGFYDQLRSLIGLEKSSNPSLDPESRRRALEKYLQATRRVHALQDELIQKETDWIMDSHYRYLKDTYVAIYSRPRTEWSPTALRNHNSAYEAFSRSENWYLEYQKGKHHYGQPKDSDLRKRPLIQFMKNHKKLVGIFNQIEGQSPTPGLWQRLRQKLGGIYQTAKVLAHLGPSAIEVIYNMYSKRIIDPNQNPIMSAASKMFKKLMSFGNINISIKNRELLPEIGPIKNGKIYIIAPNHVHPIFDHLTTAEMGLENVLVVMNADQAVPRPLSDKLVEQEKFIVVGRGSDHPLEQTLDALNASGTNTILIYPDGMTNVGLNETTPLRKKFEWGFIHALQEKGYDVEIIPVTHEKNGRSFYQHGFASLLDEIATSPSIELQAQVHSSITSTDIQYLASEFGDFTLSETIRALWNERLNLIETLNLDEQESDLARLQAFDKVVRQFNFDASSYIIPEFADGLDEQNSRPSESFQLRPRLLLENPVNKCELAFL